MLKNKHILRSRDLETGFYRRQKVAVRATSLQFRCFACYLCKLMFSSACFKQGTNSFMHSSAFRHTPAKRIEEKNKKLVNPLRGDIRHPERVL
jgi:hypothetical protein